MHGLAQLSMRRYAMIAGMPPAFVLLLVLNGIDVEDWWSMLKRRIVYWYHLISLCPLLQDESAQFKNLWVCAALSSILPAFVLLLLPWFIPDSKQTEKLLREGDVSVTEGSIWHRLMGRDWDELRWIVWHWWRFSTLTLGGEVAKSPGMPREKGLRVALVWWWIVASCFRTVVPLSSLPMFVRWKIAQDPSISHNQPFAAVSHSFPQRLFYVAMTRARNCLVQNPESPEWPFQSHDHIDHPNPFEVFSFCLKRDSGEARVSKN